MYNKATIIFAIYLMYFFISGLSTTNILRLTAGNKLSILDSKCVCDNCGSKISVFMQTPIISYIVCKGKCKKCGCHIPLYPLFLEIVVLVGMCSITTLLGFTYLSVVFSFLFYEVVRVFTVIVKKRRESDFARQYIISVATMPIYIALLEFAVLLYHLVEMNTSL